MRNNRRRSQGPSNTANTRSILSSGWKSKRWLTLRQYQIIRAFHTEIWVGRAKERWFRGSQVLILDLYGIPFSDAKSDLSFCATAGIRALFARRRLAPNCGSGNRGRPGDRVTSVTTRRGYLRHSNRAPSERKSGHRSTQIAQAISVLNLSPYLPSGRPEVAPLFNYGLAQQALSNSPSFDDPATPRSRAWAPPRKTATLPVAG
jgi:hypothetical protein